MKITVQRPILAKVVDGVKGLVSKASRYGKYTTLRADDVAGTITCSVAADEVAGKCVIDQKKVADPNLLNISESGVAVIDGERHVKTIVEDETPGSIVVTFKSKKVVKATPTPEDDLTGEGETEEQDDENGTLSFEFPDDEKIGLQSVDVNCEPVIEVGKDKVVLKGSDFQKYVKFIKEYSGKSSMNTKWANTQVTVLGTKVTMVVTNGYQLAFAEFEAEKTIEDVSITVPTDMLAAMANLANPEGSITLAIKEGTPGYLVMSQDITFASQVIGSAMFRINLSSNKFVNFTKVISALNFKSTCKANIQSLRRACRRCDIVEKVRSKAKLEVGKKVLHLFKQEDEALADGIKVQLMEATGDDMDMEISSRHIEVPAGQCEKDSLEIKFSGPKSMVLVVLDENRSVYFPPFTE